MASWYLVPCLKELFAEFDRIAAGRDHTSDGSIGDAAHQAEKSDHNPDGKGAVHAIDVDSDLHASFSMEDVIQYFVAECRKNNPNGADRGRLKYFIYNRRIWSASTGWKQETYTGSSPHTEHAHFSCEYAPEYENDTNPWGLIPKFGDDVTKDEFMAWSQEFFAKTNVGFATHMADGIGGAGPAYSVLSAAAGRTNVIKADTAILRSDVQKVLQAVSDLAGKDFTDEQAIIEGVLAGLAGADGAAETIADAVVNALPPDLAQQVVDEMAKRLAPPAQP
jgi:hypothetical protein